MVGRWKALMAGATGLVLAGAVGVLVVDASPSSTGREIRGPEITVSTAPCLEDQPCWDWRTMGNKERGVCIDGSNYIENAAGQTRPGGRACQSRPLMVRCEEGMATVSSTGLRLPVGWRFSCGREGRAIPNGQADPLAKLIRIGDSAGDGDDHMLQYVIAHELCHANLYFKLDKTHSLDSSVTQREIAADACALKYGFTKEGK